jgi:hypothetical protein
MRSRRVVICAEVMGVVLAKSVMHREWAPSYWIVLPRNRCSIAVLPCRISSVHSCSLRSLPPSADLGSFPPDQIEMKLLAR